MANIETLIHSLQAEGIENTAVLEAMRAVPRERFMDPKYAYENAAFAIESGQTISQPYIVALMTSLLLDVSIPVKKVLEVGTGSGYQAAILAQLVPQVYSIERIELLYNQARIRLLGEMNYQNIELLYGDGYEGWPEHAPYDGIIVTAAAEEIPQTLLKQLRPSGRLIIPIGRAGNTQTLKIVTNGHTEDVSFVAFVPLRTGIN